MGGLEFGYTWRVPRTSVAAGVWSWSRKTRTPGWTSLAESRCEAAGLLPEFHLCGGHRAESNIGQSSRERGVGCLVKGGKPVVEKMAGRGVGDETHLVAGARKANEDGGMNGADVGSAAGGHRSVGRIAEDNGVDLVGIVIVVLAGSWDAPNCGAGGTISAGASGGEMCMSGVTQGIEDRGERTDGDNDSEQNGSGAERLAASDIEGGSVKYGEIGGQALPYEWVALGLSRRGPGWRRSGEVGHTDSVDALLKTHPVLQGRTFTPVSAANCSRRGGWLR